MKELSIFLKESMDTKITEKEYKDFMKLVNGREVTEIVKNTLKDSKLEKGFLEILNSYAGEAMEIAMENDKSYKYALGKLGMHMTDSEAEVYMNFADKYGKDSKYDWDELANKGREMCEKIMEFLEKSVGRR